METAIKSGHEFVAFVSSRRKANAIFRILKSRGIGFDTLKKIKTPAGLNIHAKLSEEVAISILAQIIEDIRKPHQEADPNQSISLNPQEYYINPVCQVPIHKATAKHIIDYQDEQVFFCCDGCKDQFEAKPAKYILRSE